MIYVTGKTFDHRATFKTWKGVFDRKNDRWVFTDENMTIGRLMQLRHFVGCVVTDEGGREYERPWTRPAETLVIGDDATYNGLFYEKNPMLYAGFSSLQAFTEHCATLKRPTEKGTADFGWRTKHGERSYYGTNSLEDALKLARDGWTEGFGLAHIFDAPHAERKQRSYGYAGGSVNVGRMLSGNPKHMVTRTPQPKHRNITLFVETMMWAGITAENAMLRALLIASIIDMLEQQGYRCEIYAVAANKSVRDNKPQTHLCVKLKEAGERLSLLDISFALGHPSFLRRLKFACEGVFPMMGYLPTDKHMSYISRSFKQADLPLHHYYFKQLPPNDERQEAYTLDPMEMLKDILPENFPITIKGAT